ncbi:hypothetical protein EDF60_1670 [Leucobacter luti]|uniref:hypothetical protein n=1 Tax=Leucobacter luti TaxID=340320 RepID=UPI00104C31D6|nr:hypothetical protein [Leucobacter luti]MCW2287019.1 hypothetical protein [Leucobacter luti]TCK41244.1 hypothetical protein EDF60_1670 [Leucobacter luti]
MPELVSEKIVRARKAHQCRTCNQMAVMPGQEYTRSTYVFDGRIYDWVMCADCRACASFVFSWCSYDGDGIGEDQYDEWAYDTGWEADSDPATQSDEQKAAISYLVRSRKMVAGHAWVGVAGHPDDLECTHREDGTDATYCGGDERDHLWSTR